MQIPLVQFNPTDEGQPEAPPFWQPFQLSPHELPEIRAAQQVWAQQPVRYRLEILRRARLSLVREARRFAALAGSREQPHATAEALASQVLPLVEACRFLEKQAESLLASRGVGRRGRPLWLAGLNSEVRREPFGVVLIIAPGNYPLFLPGVGLFQALVAGNAVLLKPGEGGTAAAVALAEVMESAGLDPRLIRVLSENAEAARSAIEGGIDKVVFIGSAEAGEDVLKQLSAELVPATMELSGCDAVFVRSDADLELVRRALLFGLHLNGGSTCIAPRRVFVHHSLAEELEEKLADALREEGSRPLEDRRSERLLGNLVEALSQGAHFVHGGIRPGGTVLGPVVLGGANPALRLLREDVFAPVLSLVTVSDDAEAIQLARSCPFALGATVFSRDLRAAQAMASQIEAGVVVINDMIVPTADPRLPFGGRRRSGFGVMRGVEGLLEMTRTKVVAIRRGRWRPHLEPSGPNDARLFEAYLHLAHGHGWLARVRALLRLTQMLVRRSAVARTASGAPDPISIAIL